MQAAAAHRQGAYCLGEDGGCAGCGAVLRTIERAAHREDWYRRTALSDLLQLGDEKVNKDRLYRALDHLLVHKQELEAHLSKRCGELFAVQNEVLLYDVQAHILKVRRKAIRRRNVAIPAIIDLTASRCASRSW